MAQFQPLLSKLDIELFANTATASYSTVGPSGTRFTDRMLSEDIHTPQVPQITRQGTRLVTQDKHSLSIWFPTNVQLQSSDINIKESKNPKGLPAIAVLFNKRNMRKIAKKRAKKNRGVTPTTLPAFPAPVADFVKNTKKIISITQKNIKLILDKLFLNPITITLSNKSYIVKKFTWLKTLYPPYGYTIYDGNTDRWPGVVFIGDSPGAVVTFRGTAGHPMIPSPATENAGTTAAVVVPVTGHHRKGVIVDDATAGGPMIPALAAHPLHVWVKLTNSATNNNDDIMKGTIWAVRITDIRVTSPYPRYKPLDDDDGDDTDDDTDDDDDDAKEDDVSIAPPDREWGVPGNSKKWWDHQVLQWGIPQAGVGELCNRFGLMPLLAHQSASTQEMTSNNCSLSRYPVATPGTTFKIICELSLIHDNGYHNSIAKGKKETKKNLATGIKAPKKTRAQKCRQSEAQIQEIKRGLDQSDKKLVGGTRKRGTRKRGTRKRGTRKRGPRR